MYYGDPGDYEAQLKKSMSRLSEDWGEPQAEAKENENDGLYFIKTPLYSTFPSFSYMAEGNNASEIVDAVLRKTVKLTERYAGDILDILSSFSEAVANNEPYAALLCFKDSGVSAVKDIAYLTDKEILEHTSIETKDVYAVVSNTGIRSSLVSATQVWLLTHIPAREEERAVSIFTRMRKPS